MKKFILALGVVAAMFSVSSCNKSGSDNDENKAFTDSLSIALGQFSGSQLCSQYNSIPEEMRAKFDKKEMLKGIKMMIMSDSTKQSYITGLQIGMQLYGQIAQMEASGMNVDRNAVYKAYETAFLADSVADMQAISENYQSLMGRAQQIMMERQRAEQEAAAAAKRETPEAQQAIADGKAYVDNAKANDSSITTTQSGLSYKVEKEGNGENIKDTDRVVINYVGKHINGEVFDQGEGATFSPRQVIPGFSEGLQLMKKGGKYILYIPGDLAYGVDGTPDGSIKPMETLVFEVEVLDITPAQ